MSLPVMLALLVKLPADPWEAKNLRVEDLVEPHYTGYSRQRIILEEDGFGNVKNRDDVEFPGVPRKRRRAIRGRTYTEVIRGVAILTSDEKAIHAVSKANGSVTISEELTPLIVPAKGLMWKIL